MKWPNAPFLRERPRLRRNLIRAAAAGIALWFFWYPADQRELYAAIPSDAPVAMFSRNLAMEDRAFLRNPAVQEMILAAGEDPEEVLEDNSGLFWTLFGLTGENTVLGLYPNHPVADGIPVPTNLDDLFDAYSLAGASYTGWKARIIELLWRIRYVPGLGPLRTTESGTRYMEFPHARELRERNIVLGVDIVDGVLVAVLSRDPDRVRELADRVRAAGQPDAPPLAAAFGSEPSPWRGGSLRHDLWVRNPFSDTPHAEPLHVEFASFRTPGFRIRCNVPDEWTLPQPAPMTFTDFPPNEAIFWAASPAAWVTGTIPPEFDLPAVDGTAFAWLGGKPYTGHLSILETPTVGGSIPVPANWDFTAWWNGIFARLNNEAAGLKPKSDAPAENVRLVRFKKLELLGHTPEADRAFASHENGRLTVGTGYGSYRKLRAATGAAAVDKTPAILRVHADVPRIAGEAGNLAGILAIAQRVGVDVPISPDAPVLLIRALASLRALGTVDASITLSNNQKPVLDFLATGPDTRTETSNQTATP